MAERKVQGDMYGDEDDDFSDDGFSDSQSADSQEDDFDDDGHGGSFGDDDFDGDDLELSGGKRPGGFKGGRGVGGKLKNISNQHFDEVVSLESDDNEESIDTEGNATPKMRALPDSSRSSQPVGFMAETAAASAAASNASSSSKDESPMKKKNIPTKIAKLEKTSPQHRRGGDSGSESESELEESGSREFSSNHGRGGVPANSGYDPSDFANLSVSSEVRELFQYIGRYKPHNIELDSKLRCFIPDYIPAVGQIDSFIKIPRPDDAKDDLGLRVLDEPAANQTDPTLLDLQLRAISKKSNLEPMTVRSIENADKNPKAVSNWINSIKDLHRSKPPPQVHYSKSMPDIEALMQVWPDEVEHTLKTLELPSPEIDLDLRDYARVVCAFLDIPVYSSMTESLHVLFTLYSEFRNNQHFGGAIAGSPTAAAESKM